MNAAIDEFSPRCLDKRCEAKCALYVDKKRPEHRLTANTLRMGLESHNVQCLRSREYFGVIGLDEESE